MLTDYVVYVVLLLYLIMVVVVVLTLLSDRRDPVKSVAWITVVVLLPVAGLLFFVLFGQNYRRRKIFNRKEISDLRHIDNYSKRQTRQLQNIQSECPEVQAHISTVRLLLNNSKSLLTRGNSAQVLNGGEQTFSSIIPALRAAENSIHLEYYIFERDNIGNEIAEILMEKAREGVEVRFLYDDVGSWSLKRGFINRLRKAGVKAHCFMPVVFPWLSSRVNYRNHRKIIVIDGKIGYTGGLNIADRYIVGNRLGRWRDTHLRIEGGAVRMLQTTFMTDWFFASKENLFNHAERYLIHRDGFVGDVSLQIATSGPDSDWASIMQCFFSEISKAKDHIYISTPYLIPNRPVLAALKASALSGVDVRIMMPERSDSKLVHWASRSYITELLEANVKIYLFRTGFNHSKTISIDGDFSSVGSVNMDERSFDDNFEITAMIYNREITSQLERQFIADLSECQHLRLHDWENRKHKDTFKEGFARLFSPLL